MISLCVLILLLSSLGVIISGALSVIFGMLLGGMSRVNPAIKLKPRFRYGSVSTYADDIMDRLSEKEKSMLRRHERTRRALIICAVLGALSSAYLASVEDELPPHVRQLFKVGQRPASTR